MIAAAITGPAKLAAIAASTSTSDRMPRFTAVLIVAGTGRRRAAANGGTTRQASAAVRISAGAGRSAVRIITSNRAPIAVTKIINADDAARAEPPWTSPRLSTVTA